MMFSSTTCLDQPLEPSTSLQLHHHYQGHPHLLHSEGVQGQHPLQPPDQAAGHQHHCLGQWAECGDNHRRCVENISGQAKGCKLITNIAIPPPLTLCSGT